MSNVLKSIRPAAVAGMFYPADKKELIALVDRLLIKAAETPASPNATAVRGLIVPHAGYLYSGLTAAAGYRLLRRCRAAISRVIILAPSHHYPLAQPAAADYHGWQTPLGVVPAFPAPGDIGVNNFSHQAEHAIEVQLPFLQRVLKKFAILPIVVNDGGAKQLAAAITPLLNQQTMIIASSDLSHFYPEEEGRLIDQAALELIPQLATTAIRERVEACGLEAIITLLTIAKQQNWYCQLLDYRTSAEATGDTSRVVGYGCWIL